MCLQGSRVHLYHRVFRVPILGILALVLGKCLLRVEYLGSLGAGVPLNNFCAKLEAPFSDQLPQDDPGNLAIPELCTPEGPNTLAD